MAIISKLKALVGLDDGERRAGGTSVTVEREPATENERAVKEPAVEPTSETNAESEAAEPETDAASEPVDTLSGIGPAYAERLAEAGVETVGDLASADPAVLAAEIGLGEGRVEGWVEQAKDG